MKKQYLSILLLLSSMQPIMCAEADVQTTMAEYDLQIELEQLVADFNDEEFAMALRAAQNNEEIASCLIMAYQELMQGSREKIDESKKDSLIMRILSVLRYIGIDVSSLMSRSFRTNSLRTSDLTVERESRFYGPVYINNESGSEPSLVVSGTIIAGDLIISGGGGGFLPLAGGTMTGPINFAAFAGNAINVNGGVFTVNNATGNTNIAGTLTVAAINAGTEIVITSTVQDLNTTGTTNLGNGAGDATNVTGTLSVTGTTTLSSLTAQPGVVHNSATGLLSSSAVTVADAGVNASVTNTSNTFVVRDLAGRFQATDPLVAQDVATKNYVDTSIAAAPFVEIAGDTMTGTLNFNAIVGNAINVNSGAFTVNGTSGNINTTGTLGVTGVTTLNSTLTVTGTTTLSSLTAQPGVVHNSATGVLSSSAVTVADAGVNASVTNTSNTFVVRDLAGRFQATDPLVAQDVATKNYIDTAIVAAPFVEIAGDTMTGTLNFNAIVGNAINVNSGVFTVNGTSGDISTAGDLNLTTNPSTTTDGSILKNGTRFIHNFGTDNTFVGLSSGNFTLTGPRNTGFGVNALNALTSANDNVAIGYHAGQSITGGFGSAGDFNTLIGSEAGSAITIGNNHTAVGCLALQSITSGTDNIAIGGAALKSATGGSSNVAIGVSSMDTLNPGNNNVAVGQRTLPNNTGNFNVAIGATNSGFNSVLQLNTGGSNNVAIGVVGSNGAGSAAPAIANNNIFISNIGDGSESTPTMRIGTQGTQTRCFIAGIRGVTTGVLDAIPVLIDSAGQLGTVTSSIRFKENIKTLENVSSHIDAMRAVIFNRKEDVTHREEIGFIAEEVAEHFPQVIARDEHGDIHTVRYDLMTAILLAAIKELRASHKEEMEQLTTRITALEGSPA